LGDLPSFPTRRSSDLLPVTGGKTRAGITHLGAYAPKTVLTNHDLEKMMDTSDEWITSRTGIKRRHIAADDEFTSDLAFKAVEDLDRKSTRLNSSHVKI